MCHFINVWEFILHQNSSGQRPRMFLLFKQVKLSSKFFNISINLVNFAQKIFSSYLTLLLNLFSVMAPKLGATNTAKKMKKYTSSFVKVVLVFIKILLITFLSECGRYPLAVTYMAQCVKYWVRLTQMPN